MEPPRVELKHYGEFKAILADYHISSKAKEALDSLRLVVMVAPFATGRNTLIRELLKTGEYYFIVSDTTRPPQVRDGQLEQDGVQYFFRSEEEVLTDLRNGEFLEAALIHEQQVSGISMRELKKAKNHDKIAITDIEIVGADNVVNAKPDTSAIFLLPPSFEEWQERIHGRGQMSSEEINNRLASAKKEFDAAIKKDYYQFVIAEDVAKSVQIIHDIAGSGTNPHQKRGQELVNQLYNRLDKYLTR